MPDRTSYAQGAPCWVDVASPDLDASVAFYTGLFGWDHQAGGAETGHYGTFTKDGKSVAGVMPRMDPEQPIVWSTYLAADDADEVAAKVTEAGGQVVVEPMDVRDLGRMAFAVDPTGAFIGFWQAGTMTGAQLVGEPGSVAWNELATDDADAAASFYETAFGLDVERWEDALEGMDYRIFKVGGDAVGGLMPMGEQFPEGVSPHWTVCFGVEDVDATVQQAKQAGGSNPVEAFDVPGIGRIAILTDPFDARFSIMSPES